MKTQNQMILDHLRAGKSITPIQALHEYRVMRLSARIHDLTRQGWGILVRMKVARDKHTGRLKRYAEYKLTTDHGGPMK